MKWFCSNCGNECNEATITMNNVNGGTMMICKKCWKESK